MLTEILTPPAYVLPRSKAHHISPLTVAAAFAFAMLHLVGGVMLQRSHAGPMIEPSAFVALDDDAKCSADTRPLERSLPYD